MTASQRRRLVVRVLRVRRFATFRDMLEECGLDDCLPGLPGGIDEGVSVYHSFGSYSGESFATLEQRCGVTAIDVEPLS